MALDQKHGVEGSAWKNKSVSSKASTASKVRAIQRFVVVVMMPSEATRPTSKNRLPDLFARLSPISSSTIASSAMFGPDDQTARRSRRFEVGYPAGPAEQLGSDGGSRHQDSQTTID